MEILKGELFIPYYKFHSSFYSYVDGIEGVLKGIDGLSVSLAYVDGVLISPLPYIKNVKPKFLIEIDALNERVYGVNGKKLNAINEDNVMRRYLITEKFLYISFDSLSYEIKKYDTEKCDEFGGSNYCVKIRHLFSSNWDKYPKNQILHNIVRDIEKELIHRETR